MAVLNCLWSSSAYPLYLALTFSCFFFSEDLQARQNKTNNKSLWGGEGKGYLGVFFLLSSSTLGGYRFYCSLVIVGIEFTDFVIVLFTSINVYFGISETFFAEEILAFITLE